MINEFTKIILSHTPDLSMASSIAKDIFKFLYALPEDKVMVVRESFQKRKVEGGWEYKFFSDGKWEDKWNFVPAINV